ncbi:hypothetical protein [Bartonella sp. AA86SXKL]|uniref:hypothetical protein n=1 Tax=Bartonella sp. AA86SXKL TaxID=3243441 RepID=UPI0035D01F9F
MSVGLSRFFIRKFYFYSISGDCFSKVPLFFLSSIAVIPFMRSLLEAVTGALRVSLENKEYHGYERKEPGIKGKKIFTQLSSKGLPKMYRHIKASKAI